MRIRLKKSTKHQILYTSANRCTVGHGHNSRGRNGVLHRHKTRAIMLCCHSLDSWPRMAVATVSSSHSTKRMLRRLCHSVALHLPPPICPKCSMRRKCGWSSMTGNHEKKNLPSFFYLDQELSKTGHVGSHSSRARWIKGNIIIQPISQPN